MANHQGTCTESVNRKGHPWHLQQPQCGKAAKGVSPQGSPVCGLHLAMYERRTHLVAAADAEIDASDSNKRRASQACDLLEALGIKATINHSDRSAAGRYTGLVTLDPAAIFPSLGITEELPPIQERTK